MVNFRILMDYSILLGGDICICYILCIRDMNNHKTIEYRIDGFIGQRMVYLPGIVKRKLQKDVRVADLYITHIGIFPRAMRHLRERKMGCSQYILIYCVDGKGWIEMKGHRFQLQSNQLFVIPPHTPCRYGADEENPWTNYWLHFTGENAKAYSPPTGQVLDIPLAPDARVEERLALFEEILQNTEDYFRFEKVVYANICLKLFLSSISYLDVYRSVKHHSKSDTLEKVIAYMKNNVDKNIRVADLAELCHCSSSNLYKLFKRNLNSSPTDFFIHLKMERARRYLLKSDMKIKEIAHKLGYEDPFYFSRIFRQHLGMSPAHFRREER